MEQGRAINLSHPRGLFMLLFLLGFASVYASRSVNAIVKREGSLPRQVNASAVKVWPIASDFAGLKKVLVDISSCTIVDGISNKVGCVRKVEDGDKFALEKLVYLNNATMTYFYTIDCSADNNLGFQRYGDEVTVQEVDVDVSTVTWSYSFEAANDSIADTLVSLLSVKSAAMAAKMEELAK